MTFPVKEPLLCRGKSQSCSRSEHITAIDYIVGHTSAWIMKPTLDDTLTHLSYLSYRTPATTTSQNPSYRVLYCGKYLRTEQSDRKSTLAIPVFVFPRLIQLPFTGEQSVGTYSNAACGIRVNNNTSWRDKKRCWRLEKHCDD